MKVKCNNIKLQYTENRGETEIVLTTNENIHIEDLKEIISKGKELNVEIKQFRHKRSIDSNCYCFVLCQKIAEAINSTKELVYQKFIKDVGQFEIVPIKNEATKRWIEVWNSKGLGFFSEIMKDSKLEGYKNVISYYGSSVYDSKEMSVLINEIVVQCKELNINTITPKELEALNNQWGR